MRAFTSFMLGIAYAVVVASCAVEIRDGQFACGSSGECPSGFVCRASDDRCARSAEEVMDSGLDGAVDGSAPPDGDLEPDASSPDAGPPDSDGDGVPDAMDCMPSDGTVAATAMRDCSTACGAGRALCTDGVWGRCDAPTMCTCIDDSSTSAPCGPCNLGTQQYLCTENVWVEQGGCVVPSTACTPDSTQTAGACGNCGTFMQTCLSDCSWNAVTCTGQGECAPNTTQTGSQSCAGECGTGTQATMQTCDSTCHWSAPTVTGGCTGCAAVTDTDSDPCGLCGTTRRTRTCNSATCTWGAFGAFGACTGEGVCVPGTSEECGGGPCAGPHCPNGGLGTRRLNCSASCQWVEGVCTCC